MVIAVLPDGNDRPPLKNASILLKRDLSWICDVAASSSSLSDLRSRVAVLLAMTFLAVSYLGMRSSNKSLRAESFVSKASRWTAWSALTNSWLLILVDSLLSVERETVAETVLEAESTGAALALLELENIKYVKMSVPGVLKYMMRN